MWELRSAPPGMIPAPVNKKISYAPKRLQKYETWLRISVGSPEGQEHLEDLELVEV